jgi:hypothetical protein
MEHDIAAVRRVLAEVEAAPEFYTDEQLCELADLARKLTKVAAKQFVDRLLARQDA